MKTRTVPWILAAISLLVVAGPARSEGFGTPGVDGPIEGVYGLAAETDPNDDPDDNAAVDLAGGSPLLITGSLYLAGQALALLAGQQQDPVLTSDPVLPRR